MNTELLTGKKIIFLSILFLIMLMIVTAKPASTSTQTLSISEVERVVAPVALYPDSLLSEVLTASTVPDEVDQAARYLEDNGGRAAAMPSYDWDPSVKALLSFPDVLYRMDNDMAWTETLGYLVIHQLPDVMKAIQDYRRSSYEAGNLATNNYIRVDHAMAGIEILPAAQDNIYVPVYDPTLTLYSGYPLYDFLAGVVVSNWWNYRNLDWSRENIVANPEYFSQFNCPQQGYYNRFFGGYNEYLRDRAWTPTPRALNNFRDSDIGGRISHYRANLEHNLNISGWNRGGTYRHSGDASPFNSNLVHPQGSITGKYPHLFNSIEHQQINYNGLYPQINSGVIHQQGGVQGIQQRANSGFTHQQINSSRYYPHINNSFVIPQSGTGGFGGGGFQPTFNSGSSGFHPTFNSGGGGGGFHPSPGGGTFHR